MIYFLIVGFFSTDLSFFIFYKKYNFVYLQTFFCTFSIDLLYLVGKYLGQRSDNVYISIIEQFVRPSELPQARKRAERPQPPRRRHSPKSPVASTRNGNRSQKLSIYSFHRSRWIERQTQDERHSG